MISFTTSSLGQRRRDAGSHHRRGDRDRDGDGDRDSCSWWRYIIECNSPRASPSTRIERFSSVSHRILHMFLYSSPSSSRSGFTFDQSLLFRLSSSIHFRFIRANLTSASNRPFCSLMAFVFQLQGRFGQLCESEQGGKTIEDLGIEPVSSADSQPAAGGLPTLIVRLLK